MRRFLFAVGLLATVAVSEADAGYLVIRFVLDGAAGEEGPGGPGGGPGGHSGMPFASGGGGLGGSGMFRPGMMMPGAGGPVGKPDIHDPRQSIYIVVPFTKKPESRAFYPKYNVHKYINPRWDAALTHQYGSTNLLVDNIQIQWYMEFAEDPSVSRTRQSVVKDKHTKWVNHPTDAQGLLDLVTEALERGMVTEALKWADDLVEYVQKAKGPTSKQVDRFVQLYGKLQRPLRDGVRRGTEGQVWRERLLLAYPGAQELPTPHYSLIYWDAPEAERTRRAGQLEENFKAFYLFHAIQGTELQVPKEPLVALLPKTGRDAFTLARSIDGLPFVADASYSPDSDVLILSPERLDSVGQTFLRQLQQMYREGADKKALLSGSGPSILADVDEGNSQGPPGSSGLPGKLGTPDVGGGPGQQNQKIEIKHPERKKPEVIARWMTWVLVDRFAEEESELAEASREGNRQLMYATGLLPRYVVLPTWLSEGSADYLARPKGPVFSHKDDGHKDVVTVALTTGYGVANYVRQKQFRELIAHKEVSSDPGVLLRHVVGDTYFAAIRNGIDADDPKLPRQRQRKKAPAAGGPGEGPGGPFGPRPGYGPPGPMGIPGQFGPGMPDAHQEEDPALLRRKRQEFLVNKAYATAWALYYHLARNDPDGLARYISELNKLPRDLPLDETARVDVFARAFNLTTPKAFSDFGAKWLDAMTGVPTAGVDLQLADLEQHKDDHHGRGEGTPGRPGFPGNRPPNPND